MEGDRWVGLPSAGSSGSGDSDAQGRRLLHIPIIHSQAEMGSLSPTIQAMTVRRLGAKSLHPLCRRMRLNRLAIETVLVPHMWADSTWPRLTCSGRRGSLSSGI